MGGFSRRGGESVPTNMERYVSKLMDMNAKYPPPNYKYAAETPAFSLSTKYLALLN